MYLQHFSHLSINFNQDSDFFFLFSLNVLYDYFDLELNQLNKESGAYQLGDPIDF